MTSKTGSGMIECSPKGEFRRETWSSRGHGPVCIGQAGRRRWHVLRGSPLWEEEGKRVGHKHPGYSNASK